MRRAAPLLAAVAVVIAAATPASAHAHLVSSRPAAGGRLTSTVALVFDDPVDVNGSSLHLTRPDGSAVGLGPLRHERADQRDLVANVASAASGPVNLEWRALADDGHLTSGGVAFTLAGTVPARPTAAPATGTAVAAAAATGAAQVSRALDLARLVCFLALAVLCGGLVFVGLVWPAGADDSRARRLLWGAWAVGLAGGVVALALEAAYAKGLGLSGAVRLSAVADVLASHAGRIWAVDVLLYVLAAPVLSALTSRGSGAARSTAWRLGAAAVVVGLLRTPGLMAHSSEGRHAALGTVADLVHLLGVSVWLGGLVVLLFAVLPRRRVDELRTVVPRYSTIALGSVCAIVAGGAFMSWQIVGGFHGLLATDYGHLLAAKLVAFGAVLVAARASKGWVERRLDSAVVLGGDAAVVRPLVWSVAAEVALAVVVLSLASVLVGSVPGH